MPGLKSFDKSNLLNKSVSVIAPVRDLLLVNLSNVALRRLGISRVHLIESDAADYAFTRPWAVALHDQVPQADGLYWVSRQNDETRSVVLFGDRVAEGEFTESIAPTKIVSDPAFYRRLLDLAGQIDVRIL